MKRDKSDDSLGGMGDARRAKHPRWRITGCFLLLWAVSSLWLIGRYYYLRPEAEMPVDGNVATMDIYVHHEFPYMDSHGDVAIYQVGTRLAEEGQTLTVAQKHLLSEYYDFMNDKNSAICSRTSKGVLQNIAFLGCQLFCFAFCLYRLRPSFFRHSGQMMLAVVLLFCHFCITVGGYVLWLQYYGSNVIHLLTIMPLCLVPGLTTFLLGDRVSICMMILLTTLTSLFMEGDYQFILFQYSMLCAIAGIMAFRKIIRYRQILYGGCIVTLTVVVVDLFIIWRRHLTWAWDDLGAYWREIAALKLLETHDWTGLFMLELPGFWRGMLETAVLNGIVTTLFMFCLPGILERFFDVVSPIRLHALTSLEHPLLKRLHKEAEGTYSHCIEVGNMAGEAAEAIDADKELALVCGYFHDIGKLSDPQCFAENNFGQESPHAHLTPYESCNRIREHVVFGRELGRKAHLPRPILEAIYTHHGNDLVFYFYRKACKEALQKGLPPPKEADFRYRAMLPHRKEAVLIEMADICEAAARAEFRKAELIDLPFVRQFVDKLVMAKFQNGQFADAEMTLAEFTKACDSISHSLLCKYHLRPKYTETEAGAAPPVSDTKAMAPFGVTLTQGAGIVMLDAEKESETGDSGPEPSVMDGERGQDRM